MFNTKEEMVAKRDEQQEQTIARVKKEAWKLFVKRGFDATSVRDIAQNAGVSNGTVINVGTKVQLFIDLIENGSTQVMIEQLSPARTTSRRAKSSPRTLFAAFVPSLETLEKNPSVIRDYLRALLERGPSATNKERLTSILDQLAAQIAEMHGVGPQTRLARQKAFVVYSVYVNALLAVSLELMEFIEVKKLLRSEIINQCKQSEKTR